nr:alpha/beta hydrolase [Azospirillaceae bacterium]
VVPVRLYEPLWVTTRQGLSAPAVWGFETMGFWPRNALKLANAAVPGMVATAPPELNIRPSDNIAMLKALGADPLVIKGARVDALYGLTEMMGAALDALPRLDAPTLALYGAHEQVLPPEPVAKAKAILAANPKATVKEYPDGWHMLLRDLQAARVWEDAAAWIDDRLRD